MKKGNIRCEEFHPRIMTFSSLRGYLENLQTRFTRFLAASFTHDADIQHLFVAKKYPN
ncbi:hypothetical protein KAU30_03980 [Candidatus Bathyarchaeota archaeon]|nr:hypothetical protein [Candidatus Bathyarchaeota archaeon]